MTSQIYKAGDDQMAPENDFILRDDEQIGPENNPIAPEDSPTMSEGDQVVPTDDQVVPMDEQVVPDASPTMLADDQVVPTDDQVVLTDEQVVPDASPTMSADDKVVPTDEQVVPTDDQIVPDDSRTMLADDQVIAADEPAADEVSAPDQGAAWVAADPNPPATAVYEYRAFAPVVTVAPVIDVAEEPDSAGPSADGPPAGTIAAQEIQAFPGSPATGDNTGAGGRWREIQAMFVDDPRASVELAAGLVDGKVEALVTSVRDRQQSLQSAWLGAETGTEELRMALQHYRAFWNSLEDLPRPA